jgi:hypothetical protein
MPANVLLKPAPAPWVHDPTLNVATANGVPVRIVISDLEAMHHYVFLFDVEATVSPADLTGFREKARNILDSKFQTFPDGNVLKDKFPETRDALIAALKATAGSCINIDAKNTPLDESATFDQVKKEFTDLLVAAIEKQGKLLTQTKDARSGPIKQLRTALADLRSPALIVVAGVNDLSKDDTTLADLKEWPLLPAFVRLTPVELADVKNGADPTSVTPVADLPDVPTAQDASVREAGYRKTAILTTQIGDWLGQFTRSGAAQKLVADGKITMADLTNLQTAAKKAADAANEAKERMNEIVGLADGRDKPIKQVADQLTLIATSSVTITTSTLGTFDTFSHYYVTADAGVLYAPEIRTTAPYIGTNFYLRPVNRDVSLTKKSSFGRRFALIVGLTMKTIEDSQKQRRADLFGTQSLVVGAGYRITDIFRVGTGVLVFNRKNPNPLIKTQHVGSVPYVSISFDWDLAKTFGGLSKLFQ